MGNFGNCLILGMEGVIYFVFVGIVLDSIFLEMVGFNGLVSVVGIIIDSFNFYVVGNGFKIVVVKLDCFSDLGEGVFFWLVIN